ncbi:MAG: hypothetical protein R3B82_29985 [Sandaracinaceae bacterium]
MARTILAEHSPTPIRDVRDGEVVKIVGRVAARDEVLIAPVSRHRCVAYYVFAEARYATTRNKGWAPAIRERQIVAPIVVDDTGRAFVEVDDVEVVVVKDVHRDVGAGADPHVDALMRAHGRDPHKVRLREGSIDVGERVAIVGLARWRVDLVAHGYRGRSEVLELVAPPEHPLILSDDPETFG